MNEKINNMIPLAIRVINDNLYNKEKKILPKEFKGYIPSMGASIIQAGLLATLAFYQNDSGKKADSSNLLKAILSLIKQDESDETNLIKYVIDRSKKDHVNGVYVSEKDLDFDKLYVLEEKISDALIALKLALRTFKIEE
jgi:CRISPR-associated protein Cmr5